MKKAIRILSVLLATALLLGALPVSAAQEDKPARKATVQIISEPIYDCFFPAFIYDRVSYNYNGEYCYMDPFGKIMIRDIENIEISGSGGYYKREGNTAAILDRNGKAVTPYVQHLGFAAAISDVKDSKSGKVYACLHKTESSKVVRTMLRDGAGKNPLAKDYQNADYVMYDGKIAVCENDKWGVVRCDGTVLLPFRYDGLQQYSEDHFVFQLGNKYGAMRLDGTVLIDPAEGWLSRYRSYLQRRKGENYLMYTFSGKPITTCTYEEANLFGEREAYLPKDGKYGLIDTDGNVILDCEYDGYHYQRYGYLLYKNNPDGSKTFAGGSAPQGVCLTGKMGTKAVVSDFGMLVEQDGGVMYYSFDGETETFLPDVCVTEEYGSDFLFVMNSDKKFSLVGQKGEYLTDFIYNGIQIHGNIKGICEAQKDGKCYLLDEDGQDVLGFAIDNDGISLSFSDSSNYATYAIDGKRGILRYVGPDDPLFLDVAHGQWYENAVEACYAEGLMNGTGGGKFSPKQVTSRAMLVQVLYNISGEAAPSYGFADVPENKWYAPAVNWAAANGIVHGVSATHFAPDAAITREQVASILYRYAEEQGMDVSKAAELGKFKDEASVSDWAETAIRWAVSIGILSGNEQSQLLPKGQASRAEIASILARFSKWSKA